MAPPNRSDINSQHRSYQTSTGRRQDPGERFTQVMLRQADPATHDPYALDLIRLLGSFDTRRDKAGIDRNSWHQLNDVFHGDRQLADQRPWIRTAHAAMVAIVEVEDWEDNIPLAAMRFRDAMGIGRERVGKARGARRAKAVREAGANAGGSEAMGWRAVWVLLLAVCLGLGVGLGLVLAVGLCYVGMRVVFPSSFKV